MKHLIQYIAICIIGLLIQSTQLHAQTVYTLKQCIDIAIEKNLAINQKKFQEERNSVQWNQAKMDLLPYVNSNINQGLSFGRSIDPFTNSYTTQEINSTGIGIGAGITLFRGFSLQNSIKQKAYSWESSSYSVEDQKDQIAMSVMLAYLEILTQEALLEQANIQLNLSREQVQRLKVLDESGAIKPSDLSDIQGQMMNDELAVIRTETNIKNAKLALCRLLNIPFTEDMQVEKMNPTEALQLPNQSAEQLYGYAVQHLPNVKAAEYNEKSAEMDLKVQKGRLWPQLQLGTNLNTNYSSLANNNTLKSSQAYASDDYIDLGGTSYPVYKIQNQYESSRIPYFDQIKNNRYTTAFVSLQIPLFNNWIGRNNIRLSKINLKEAQYQTKSIKTALQIEIEQAWENMQMGQKELLALENQQKAYSNSFDAAQVRLTEGVGNSVDYLISKNNLDRVNSQLIVSKYSLLLRSKILAYYEGKKSW